MVARGDAPPPDLSGIVAMTLNRDAKSEQVALFIRNVQSDFRLRLARILVLALVLAGLQAEYRWQHGLEEAVPVSTATFVRP